LVRRKKKGSIVQKFRTGYSLDARKTMGEKHNLLSRGRLTLGDRGGEAPAGEDFGVTFKRNGAREKMRPGIKRTFKFVFGRARKQS